MCVVLRVTVVKVLMGNLIVLAASSFWHFIITSCPIDEHATRRVRVLDHRRCELARPTVRQATRTFLGPAEREGAAAPRCFQLFGFDVLLDADGRPWVLEVNLDPSLRTDTQLDWRVKSRVLVDVLNLVGVGGGGEGPPPTDAPQHGGWRRLQPVQAGSR